MRFRPLAAVLIAALLSACNPTPAENTPAPAEPTSAAVQPTAADQQAADATAAPADATRLPDAPASAVASASFEQADCMFEAPEGREVECGYLTVPENRATGGDRTIRLAVGVFKSASTSPKPDPIVYLEGGPGGNALENWSEAFERVFGPFAEERDFIIFDQRGTGYSEPKLACQESIDLGYELLDKQVPLEESNQRSFEALAACNKRLAAEGVDFSAYNSLESAADLDALRDALGFEQWNVYGISYGTRLALTAMREHPEGIRSVVLDSVVPVESNESELPNGVATVFETFFAGCAADSACNEAYPNLEDTFYTLVDTLNAEPVMQQWTDSDDGKTYDVLLTGDSLIGALFFSLYQTTVIPLMPRAIASAAEGADYALLTQLAYLQTSQNKSFSIGMYYSVRCHEEVAFETPEQLSAADDEFPQLRGLFDMGTYTPVCGAWNAGAAPAVENQPVTSDLPTLVMSGEYDPVTPPADAKKVADTLERSFYVNFTGYGHGVSIDGDCAVGITTSFFEDPSAQPDVSCVDELAGPEFAVPEGPIALVPFEDATIGMQGVAPDGWEQSSPGTWVRGAGDAVLLQFSAPRAPADMLDFFTEQFKLSAAPEAAGEYRSQRYTWSLYTLNVDNQPGNLALVEDGGTTLVVLVVAPPIDSQELYDTLFIPALDAAQPL
ncbi:MAG: alpha/beta fold hydrolase [Roseiflexaceae bacterium]|nr:alpha/beta fold hydrolase [Roseiflexaceae bacterium]